MSGHKPWSEIRYKNRLTPGPWMTLRPGSNFEVPSFQLSGSVAHIPLATGKSKKLYEAAVARALYDACQKPLGRGHVLVRYDAEVSIAADDRLYHRIYS